jgi:hypothetical protein
MKVGILGTGDVGRALGKGFVALGHEVMMGARDRDNPRAAAWAGEVGGRARTGTFADAADFGEIVVLCTLGTANRQVIAAVGAGAVEGKLVIDTTNPLDFSSGAPRLALSGDDSGGEEVQRLWPGARVVKAWNTVGHAFMFRPDFPGGPPDMFICGDDDGAKRRVRALLTDFGWGVIDVGGIESSRYLEAMCMVWVITALRANQWAQAFKLLRL